MTRPGAYEIPSYAIGLLFFTNPTADAQPRISALRDESRQSRGGQAPAEFGLAGVDFTQASVRLFSQRGVDQRRQADSRPLAEGSADPLVAPSLPCDALP